VETILLAVERTANVHLTVVGDGPELPMLEGLARQLALGGRVEFTGRQSNENARRIMGASDALVLLSQYEGLSHTLLEAASAGVPCIASSAGGNPEAVRDGETGLLIPYGDVRALQNAMEVLRDAPGLRERLGAAAAAFGRTFSFDATAAEYAGHLAAADGAG
jgi:glycosyltransferase involved in cell wall biosynthesis